MFISATVAIAGDIAAEAPTVAVAVAADPGEGVEVTPELLRVMCRWLSCLKLKLFSCHWIEKKTCEFELNLFEAS